MKRYRTYVYVLKTQFPQYTDSGITVLENSIGEIEDDEASGVSYLENVVGPLIPPPIPDRRSPPTNRYSYRQAIYNRDMLNGEADVG